jgi:hypothetical protein
VWFVFQEFVLGSGGGTMSKTRNVVRSMAVGAAVAVALGASAWAGITATGSGSHGESSGTTSRVDAGNWSPNTGGTVVVAGNWSPNVVVAK